MSVTAARRRGEGNGAAARGGGTTALVHYNRMCTEIAAARRIDEVQQIRNKAIALQLYARQAKDTALERQVRAIRVRAERRAGQLLKAIPRAKGGRRPKDKHRKAGAPATLAEAGISGNQSATWQKLAGMSEADFERDLAAVAMPTGARVVAAHEARKRPASEPSPEPPPAGLLACSLLARFEAKGLLAIDPIGLLAGLPDDVAGLVRELVPKVTAWLSKLVDLPAEPARAAQPQTDAPAAAGWRQPGIRRCLRCQRPFTSAHAGNRLCRECGSRD